MKIDLTGWVIVHDGAEGFLGRAVKRDEHVVELDPAFQYIANTQVAVSPNGEFRVNRPKFVVPLEMWPSKGMAIRVRWTRIIALDGLDALDRAEMERLVEQACTIQNDLLAQRSGLTLARALPKMPMPTGLT